MSNTKRIKILNYRNSNGMSPNPDNIDYGEIAIGYKKDHEAIYIKNNINEIVDFTPIAIVNITYNELKNLRDNSNLKPSQYYRITDFVTTVANDPEARSAGHPFDIIVMASEKDTLQEECYAIQHENDKYFANCNLAAWKIWYCLDNDNTKYAWADTTNGKGIIYRMIDEWQNDCPYDFKNVQFKRYAVEDVSPNDELADLNGTYIGYNSNMNGLNIPDQSDFIWAYTFSIGERIDVPNDASMIGYNSTDIGEGYGYKGYYGDNTIKPSSSRTLIDEVVYSVFCLNNIVWWTNNSQHRSLINGNHIESECYNMTLSGHGTIIEHDCFNLIMGDRCYGNSFKTECINNTFGDDCSNNTFGNDCCRNTFGASCRTNTFGNYCYHNIFAWNCINNTFGNYCGDNTFGNVCHSNTFGNSCTSNTFGNYFQYNTVGNDIQWIKIPTQNIYHTQILNGTKGTNDGTKLTIEFIPETTYSQFAGFTSDGVLEIWVEADKPTDVINLTYNELKNLRDNSQLKPGQLYRITDFVTTVANDPEAQSAGHQFDIIVMASDKDTLQEDCYAIQHEGDAYFANCNLAAWKIWYCLDNDTTKYMWADTANGKGVLYRMIDEWQNDCPYDFKNVQFKRYAVDVGLHGELTDLDGTYIGYNSQMTGLNIRDQDDFIWAYTFSIGERIDVPNDASIIGYNSRDVGAGYGEKGYYGDNTIKPSSSRELIDGEVYSIFCLNNIVWWTNNTLSRSAINGNHIESECYNMTLSGRRTIIEHDCFNFIMGENCYGNSFKTECTHNTFGYECYGNTFGNTCCRNILGYSCDDNTFGNGCNENSLVAIAFSNSFGNGCSRNTFGKECQGNSFGNGCSRNTFGDNCVYNSFGKNCESNSFGNDFQSNTLGNDVQWIEIPTKKIYHTQILNGTKGTYDKKLTIGFTPETTYSQFAGFASDGVLETWVEADDANGVDCGSY